MLAFTKTCTLASATLPSSLDMVAENKIISKGLFCNIDTIRFLNLLLDLQWGAIQAPFYGFGKLLTSKN